MNSIRKIIKIIQEDIVGTDNRVIAITWLVCLTGLVGLGFYLGSESMSFLGVADSREQQVNFEYPVEIRRVHVISGQSVKKGDLLVELSQSELNEKIRLLRSQISKLKAELNVRRRLNSIVSNGGEGRESELSDPLAVDIADLSEEMDYLEAQKKNLYVFAEVDGIVGAVNFKKGEKVPAFASLVTLSPENPSYVEGFVHENLHTKLEIGKSVTVYPMSSTTRPLQGKVVSVGSRIILIPTRLMLYPNMQVWGREVVVEIPPHNDLLLGEKVQIKPKFEFLKFPLAIAATELAAAGTAEKNLTAAAGVGPQTMRMPPQLARRLAFEPSGVIYLEDIKKFLVVSDDTDKQNSPFLFLVDREGQIEDQSLRVPGVDEVSDLESISQSGEYVYLMTSQGLSKKGKDKTERNQFIRVKRRGLELEGTQNLEFKPLLLKAVMASADAKLKAVFRQTADIEIESHFVDGNDLYIGFKAPVDTEGRSLVLVVSDVNSIFQARKISPLQISKVKWIDFAVQGEAPYRLSDLIRIKGRMYATTVNSSEDGGAVWRLQESDGVLVAEQLKAFTNLKPEGIAFDPEDSTLFVTFDLKQETAKFARIPLVINGSAAQAAHGK